MRNKNQKIKYYICDSYINDNKFLENKVLNNDLIIESEIIDGGEIEFCNDILTLETDKLSENSLEFKNISDIFDKLYEACGNIQSVVDMFQLDMEDLFVLKYDIPNNEYSLIPTLLFFKELQSFVGRNIDFEDDDDDDDDDEIEDFEDQVDLDSFKMLNPLPLDYMKRFEDVVRKLLGDKFKHLQITDGIVDSLVTKLDSGSLFYGMCEYDHIKFPSTLYESLIAERGLSFIVLTDSKLDNTSFKELYVFDVNFIDVPEDPKDEDFHHMNFEFRNIPAETVKEIYEGIDDDTYVYCDLDGNRIMHLEN